jgi:hypothetical protein
MGQVISSMVDIGTSCHAARLAVFLCPQKHWNALIFRGALGVDAEDNIKALNQVVRPPSCMLTAGT